MIVDTIVLSIGLCHIFVDFTTIPEALEVYFRYPHLDHRWCQNANSELPLYQSHFYTAHTPIPGARMIASFWPNLGPRNSSKTIELAVI